MVYACLMIFKFSGILTHNELCIMGALLYECNKNICIAQMWKLKFENIFYIDLIFRDLIAILGKKIKKAAFLVNVKFENWI